MKSRTSFFNFTVLKKDLTRFSPLWALLLIFSVLSLLTNSLIGALLGSVTGNYTVNPFLVESIAASIQLHGVTQTFYGGLFAILIFGDLCKPRAAGSLHALPLRREGWFFTHTVAAICMFLLYYGIPSLLSLVTLKEFWYIGLLGLAVGFGLFLFYFALGAFAIQCAGSRLGAAAVYVLLNFLMPLITYLGQTFYEPQLYGVPFESPVLNLLCPTAEITSREFVNITGEYAGPAPQQYTITFHGIIPGDWWYLLGVVAAGAVLWLLALLLYRRRHVERAGSFIALPWVGKVFLIGLTLFSGAVWFRIGGQSYILLLIGLAVGFFCGLMLLEKQLKVFHLKSFLAFGLVAALLFGSVGIVLVDPLGIEEYVPAADQVSAAILGVDDTYDRVYYMYDAEDVRLDTPEELQKLEALHKALIGEKSKATASRTLASNLINASTPKLHITYRLKNGSTVRRAYPRPTKDTVQTQVKQLLSRIDIFETTENLRNVSSIEYVNYSDIIDSKTLPDLLILANPLTPDTSEFRTSYTIRHNAETTLDQDPLALGLWEAAWKDCEAGGMTQGGNYHTDIVGKLLITFRSTDGTTDTMRLIIYDHCYNFRDYLLALKNAQ